MPSSPPPPKVDAEKDFENLDAGLRTVYEKAAYRTPLSGRDFNPDCWMNGIETFRSARKTLKPDNPAFDVFNRNYEIWTEKEKKEHMEQHEFDFTLGVSQNKRNHWPDGRLKTEEEREKTKEECRNDGK